MLFSYKEQMLAHRRSEMCGWGMMMVVELIKDKESLEFFDASIQAESWPSNYFKHGLVMYGALYGPRRQPAFRRGIPSWLSPPLTITTDEA